MGTPSIFHGVLQYSTSFLTIRPHGLQARVPAQIVDVPVGPHDTLLVMPDAGAQSSGTERAADVHVRARCRWGGS
jgi:hypothetical protein